MKKYNLIIFNHLKKTFFFSLSNKLEFLFFFFFMLFKIKMFDIIKKYLNYIEHLRILNFKN